MARTSSVCKPETPNAAACGVALAVGILAIQGGEDVKTTAGLTPQRVSRRFTPDLVAVSARRHTQSILSAMPT